MLRRTNTSLAVVSGAGLFKSTPARLSFGMCDNPRGQMGRRLTTDENTKAPYGMPRYDWDDYDYKKSDFHPGAQQPVCNRYQHELWHMFCMSSNGKFANQLRDKHFYYERGTGSGRVICKHCDRPVDEHFQGYKLRAIPWGQALNTDDNMSQGPMGRDGNSDNYQRNLGLNVAERGMVDPTAARGILPDFRHMLPWNINVDHWVDPSKTDKRYFWKGPASQRQSRWWAPGIGLFDTNQIAPKATRYKMATQIRENLCGPTVQGAALARKEAEKEAKRLARIEAYKKDQALMLEQDSKLEKLPGGGSAIAKIDDAVATQLKEQKYGHALKQVDESIPIPEYDRECKGFGKPSGFHRWLIPDIKMKPSDFSGWSKIKL